MELNQTASPTPQKRFNLWLIVTIVLVVFLIAGGVVFAWQKSVGDKAKNNLQSQINTLQSQVQQLTNVAPTNNNQCVAEGENISTTLGPSGETFGPQKCCLGLSSIDAVTFEDGECHTLASSFTCAYCGNGACGTGENKCNCPTDCKDSVDVTADWKTYTDTKYEFEIKYPNDWTKETDYILYSYAGYGYVGFKKEDTTQEKITGGDGLFTPFYLININVSDNSKDVSLKDFALQALQKGSVLKKGLTYTQVAGQQAVSFEVAGGYLPGPDVVTIIAYKGKFYTLNYSGVVHSETNYKFIDTYNQMLSTFKFTK